MADDPKTTDVGGRYAQALFDLASEADAIGPVEADLVSFSSALSESGDLRRLLASPIFSAENKAAALAGLAGKASFNPTTAKFLGLMATNGRAAAIPAAIAAYRRLSAERRGVISAEVTTALALTPAQTKGLSAALRQALGKDPEITAKVDPSILGGLKVKVGSRLYDASLKSRLDSLKFALKRA